MARRTVSTTFQGGMISDEPKPGTVRYLENFAIRPDGLIPIQPVSTYSANVTGIQYATSNVTNINASASVGGWSGGGTDHPKIGFVGLVDYATATAAPTALSQWTTSFASHGIGSESPVSRALVMMSAPSYSLPASLYEVCNPGPTGVGTNTDESFASSTWRMAANGGVYCAAWAEASTATATVSASMSAVVGNAPMRGVPWWVNTEDEVLMIQRARSADHYSAVRFGGATARKQVEFSTAGAVTAATANQFRISTTSTGFTDEVLVHGGTTAITDHIHIGAYLGVAIGDGLVIRGTGPTSQHCHEFRITEILDNSNYPCTVKLDKKIQIATTGRYVRAVAMNAAVLQANQLSAIAATQPFATPAIYPAGNYGFYTDSAPIPRGPDGACYHQGRLWLAEGGRIRWSGTVDETLQITATSLMATASATTATLTASVNFGIEYKHINLWSTAGYLDPFPGRGGRIVGLCSFKDELLILKTGSLCRLVGGVSYDGASNNLDLQLITEHAGPESKYSWAETPDGIVFTSDSRIFLYDGSQVVDISEGAVANSFQEHICSDRHTSLNAESSERIATKVTTDGEYVYFTPMRYTHTTSTASFEYGFDENDYLGESQHNRHLVLDLAKRKWTYLSHSLLGIPSEVITLRTSRGSKWAKLWLSSWRARPTATGNHAKLEVYDIHNIFHEEGPRAHATLATSTASPWSKTTTEPYSSHLITHPMMGYGNFKPVRPRSAAIKRTLAISSTSTSTNSAYNVDNLQVYDGEPTTAPYYETFGSYGNTPEWWAPIASEATARRTASEMDDPNWQMRSRWEVEGTTSTARAAGLVDRMLLDTFDGAMTAPTLHYRDYYWSRDREADTYRFGKYIVHALELEYDEVENGTDR